MELLAKPDPVTVTLVVPVACRPVFGVTVMVAVLAAPAGAEATAEKAAIPVADKASALTNPTQPRKRIPGRMLPPRSVVKTSPVPRGTYPPRQTETIVKHLRVAMAASIRLRARPLQAPPWSNIGG